MREKEKAGGFVGLFEKERLVERYFVSALRRAFRTFTSASAPETAARAFACLTSAWSNSRFTCVRSSGIELECGGRAELADDFVCDASVVVICILSQSEGGDGFGLF